MEKTLKDKHDFKSDFIFKAKVKTLTFKRHISNFQHPLKKFEISDHLANAPIIAQSDSELWNPSDNNDNWILTAGKIENLRVAIKKINGIEIKANQIFSFWKHIGKPLSLKGYVKGREVREGCVLPVVAGGLCQLSNALYDAALKANFEIIERHRHTKVIKGSLAELGRDATVKWNYVDLRFKSQFDFRIEAELSSNQLLIAFKSLHVNSTQEVINQKFFSSDKLNDCFSCGNTECYKHPKQETFKREMAATAFVLDDKWPEYDAFLSEHYKGPKHFILPMKKLPFLSSNRYNWSISNEDVLKTLSLQGLSRALRLRFAKKGTNVFSLLLDCDEELALAAAKRIPVHVTHLVIAQNLLPFLYKSGALGGRTYDVLMNRLPFEILHQKLDAAHQLHKESLTLNDFRASEALIKLENKALTQAKSIITPHAEIAALFKNKVIQLNWKLPQSKPSSNEKKNVILFPASSFGRKGAYEMKRLAMDLGLELTIAGPSIEHIGFWEGVKTRSFDGNLKRVAILIYPPHVEHQPRLVLKAIAAGIPVVVSDACGIQAAENVKVVKSGHYEDLKLAVTATLNEIKMVNSIVEQ